MREKAWAESVCGRAGPRAGEGRGGGAAVGRGEGGARRRSGSSLTILRTAR